MNLQAVAEIGSGQWVANYITICTEPYETFFTCSPENVIEDWLSISFNSKDFAPLFYALWRLTSLYKA